MSQTGVNIPLISYGPSGSGVVNVFGLTGSVTQQPVPYVSVSEEMITYGRRWGQSTSITLNGQLTGENHDKLVNFRDQVINNFSNNQFGRFLIRENNSEIFSREVCKVESINFGSSQYGKILDYTINIRGYDPNLFTGTYGVTDPVNKISIEEQDDGKYRYIHEVSANGFNTSTAYDNSFDNAHSYVKSLTGLGVGTPWPEQGTDIATTGDHHPSSPPGGYYASYLTSISESVDRARGSYSVVENYLVDANYGVNDPLLSFSCDVKSGINENYATVSLSVVAKGGLTGMTGLDGAGQKFSNLSNSSLKTYVNDTLIPSLPVKAKQLSNVDSLHSTPVSSNMSVDMQTNEVRVDVSFDNNPLFTGQNAFLDYDVSIKRDEVTNIDTIDINGEIIARGNNKQKFQNAMSYYTSIEKDLGQHLANLASGVWTTLGTAQGGYPARGFNPEPKTISVDKNPIAGTISISASFDDKDYYGSTYDLEYNSADGSKTKISDVASEINYQWSVKASVPHYTPTPAVDKPGLYMIYDSHTNKRETFEFSVDAKAKALYLGGDEILTMTDFYSAQRLIGDKHATDHIEEAKNPAMKSFNINKTNAGASLSSSFTQQKKHETLEKDKTKIKGKYIN